MAFSLEGLRLDGCIMEPASSTSYRTIFDDRPVPERVDLRDRCTPVEDQGQIGSCTANAVVGAMEYHFMVSQGWSPDLSRLFVYYNSRRLRGTVMQDTGATIPEAMASLLAYGSCKEELWPYNPMLFAMQPPPNAYDSAREHSAMQYARVDKVNGSIHALAEGIPVVFGTMIPSRCYEEAAKTGVMPQATDAERRGRPGGGHAMLMVGYDKPRRMFLVRNSWGRSWGEDGYCWIPFDLMDFFSPADQFWIVMTLAQSMKLPVVKPGGESADDRTKMPEMLHGGGMRDTAARMREEIRASLTKDIAGASSKIDELLSRSGRNRGD